MRADPRNATSSSPSSPSSNGALVIFQFVSLGLILAVGSAGNCVVVYAIGRHFRLRRSPYSLMCGFVSLDLVRLCLCFPLAFVAAVQPLHSRLLCQWMAFANTFCLLGNELGILGMALDRYVDNKHRTLYRRKWRGSVGLALLVTSWALALVLSLPAIPNSGRTRLKAECTFPSAKNFDVPAWLVGLALSFILTNLIYVRLFVFLRGRRKMRPVIYEPAVSENWGFQGVPVTNRWLAADPPISVLSGSNIHEAALWRSKRQKENEKLTKLCLLIHVIFTLTWLPYVVICFCLAFDRSGAVPPWVEISSTWLTYVQVTITPFTFFSLARFSRRTVDHRPSI